MTTITIQDHADTNAEPPAYARERLKLELEASPTNSQIKAIIAILMPEKPPRAKRSDAGSKRKAVA